MVLAELSITPMDKGSHVGEYVARVLDVIDKSGLTYQLTAMGTLIEGEWDPVFGVITRCFEALRTDCTRISCSVKIDYQAEKKNLLKSKVTSVEEKLHRKLHTTCAGF